IFEERNVVRKMAGDQQTKGRLPLWAIDRPRPAAENANDSCSFARDAETCSHRALLQRQQRHL
ncbi:MAG: hypothetical protein WBD15_14525, partial [Pseudolabrys sp.]